MNRLARFANDALPWSILGALLHQSALAEDPSAVDAWNDMNDAVLAARLDGTTMASLLPVLTEERLRSAPWSCADPSAATAATKDWWEQCAHGGELIDFYALTDDRVGLVRATVACVRAVLKQASISDARVDAALAATERWTVGDEAIETVRTLADQVWNEVAAGDMPSVGAAAYNAAISAVDPGGAYVVLDSLGDVLADRTGKEEALAMLAMQVRACLCCPTFEAPEPVE